MNEGQNGIFSGLAGSDSSNQSNFGLQTPAPPGGGLVVATSSSVEKTLGSPTSGSSF